MLRRLRGFTIVEALVAAVLLGVGVTACLAAMGALAKGETRIRDVERFTALARSKYDELSLEDANAAGDESGDFADQGAPDVEWTWTTTPSEVESLDTIKLTVTRQGGGDDAPQAVLSGLRYRPTASTATAASGAATGASN